MARALWLGVLVLACGGAERDEPYACNVPEVASVGSDLRIECGRLRMNIRLAKALLVTHEVVPENRVDELFRDARLHIHNRMCLNDDAQETNVCRVGRTYAGSPDVDLAQTGIGLLHEMVHRWEDRSSPLTFAAKAVIDGHIGWPERHWDAGRAYEEQANTQIQAW
jgi:hypothetical protein